VQCLPRPALPRPLSAGKGRGKAAPAAAAAAAAAAAGEAKNIASSQAFNLLCAFFNLLLLCLQRANVLLRFIYPHPSPFASAAPPRLNPYLAIQSKLAFRFGAHLLTRQLETEYYSQTKTQSQIAAKWNSSFCFCC